MQGIITKSGNNIFCRIYGLAVMLSVATRTTNKYIDKIAWKLHNPTYIWLCIVS